MIRHPLEEEIHKVCRRHQIVTRFRGHQIVTRFRGHQIVTRFRAHQIVNRFRAHIAREDGNVESALVIIPLLVLFLIGAQIIAATNIRNADLALAQGDAASRAISQEFYPDDEIIEIGGRVEKIRVLITHRSHTIPQLVPGLIELMGGAPTSDVVGVAVIEPSSS
jgi:hypothetical protein